MTYDHQPIILIGAARSGTKLVRDLVAEHPTVDRVPYDINYIWRLGNENIPHDELSPELLTPRIRQRILGNFKKYSSGAPFLVEKTVSNCLRVPFVHDVFPDAKFIHLVRDGRDVVESAYRQWTAPSDWRYVFKKARSFPLTEAFGYALSYGANTLRKLMTKEKGKVSTWGPRYEGIDEDIASKKILEVCASQWNRSIERALCGLNSLPAEQVFTIRYEEFVQKPRVHLESLAQFVKTDPGPYSDLTLEIVSQNNIGKGPHNLGKDQIDLILPHIQNALTLLGYT